MDVVSVAITKRSHSRDFEYGVFQPEKDLLPTRIAFGDSNSNVLQVVQNSTLRTTQLMRRNFDTALFLDHVDST